MHVIEENAPAVYVIVDGNLILRAMTRWELTEQCTIQPRCADAQSHALRELIVSSNCFSTYISWNSLIAQHGMSFV